MFQERERFDLRTPLPVTLTEPGTHQRFLDEQSELQPQAVQSFVLSFDPDRE